MCVLLPDLYAYVCLSRGDREISINPREAVPLSPRADRLGAKKTLGLEQAAYGRNSSTAGP